jgi:hypothetical protein
VFIPVSASVALDRIYRFVRERQLICEIQQAKDGEGKSFHSIDQYKRYE